MLERTRQGWRYAVYVWTADESEAVLAPEAGVARAREIAPGTFHAIPGEADCRTCHENDDTPVLGFSALQLSDDRDPLAPHAEPPPDGALTLSGLVAEGLLWPADAFRRAPRIDAPTPEARAALGYLHGNCAHCHTFDGPLASVGMDLLQRAASPGSALETTVHVPSRFVLPGANDSVRIAPGDPALSAVVHRMKATDEISRMPPLGTRIVDEAAIALLERWITSLQSQPPQGAVP